MKQLILTPDPLSRRQLLSLAGKGLLLASAVGPLSALTGCGGSSGTSSITRSVSNRWTQTLMDTISAVRPGPPMTARAIGMVATAIYDAWACYDSKALGTRLGSQLRRPTAEHQVANKAKAVSFAAYRVLLDLYPSQKPRFDAMMAELGYNPNDFSTDPNTPEGIGNLVSTALLNFRHNDGSNQAGNYADTTGYVPVNTPDSVVDPSQWQQLRFANGATPGFIAPHWGNVVPFALTSPSSIRPSAPPNYASSTYRDQAQEVLDVLERLDDERKVIAEYWADGPGSVLPPGHWQLFGQVISERDRHNLDQDVKMFFMLGNAVFDAGVACWDCKRFFNSSRPFTAIRALYAGQTVPTFGGPGTGITTGDGATWMPYQSPNFITPPFPEFTSGHSTFSAAAAEVLKRFTGSDRFNHAVTINPGDQLFETGVPASPITLSWPTFSSAADQAGISRIYGGIHFRPGDLEARRCGRIVGERVWEVCTSYIEGTAPDRTP